jgi:dTDP-4-amino-4,6-dideoxygalactose transaminase
MSDLQAAYLWAQLEAAGGLTSSVWRCGRTTTMPCCRWRAPGVSICIVPADCGQNAHMFYIKLRDIDDRSKLIAWLKEAEILAVFHYIPLHSCPAGELRRVPRDGSLHDPGERTPAAPAVILQFVER